MHQSLPGRTPRASARASCARRPSDTLGPVKETKPALLADQLLKNPLGQIFAFEYAITGGWSDPAVAKLAIAPTAEPLKPGTSD